MDNLIDTILDLTEEHVQFVDIVARQKIWGEACIKLKGVCIMLVSMSHFRILARIWQTLFFWNADNPASLFLLLFNGGWSRCRGASASSWF